MYVGIDIGTGSLKAVLGLKSGTHTITGAGFLEYCKSRI